jgi:hypothetical protein
VADRDGKEARRRLFGREARQIGSFSMIQPHKAKASSAALRKVADGVPRRNVSDLAWMSDAYDAADQIGEVGFVMNLTANTGAKVDLVAEVYNPDERAWEPADDERPLRVMAAFIGPQGGQQELKRRAILHLSIAGESTLVGTPTDENGADTGIWWEFLSPLELTVTRGQHPIRRRDGTSNSEELGDNHYLARCWRSHPRYTDHSDSALRRVLPICQEIITLTQMVDVAAKSRLSAGVLYVPEEITFAVSDDESADNPDGLDPFTAELLRHMSTPIEDRTSAASLVPLVVRGPAELKSAMGLIEIVRGFDDWAQRLRQEALQRLAGGLDIDPAIVDKASLNHWTAYNVDIDFVTKHVIPVTELLADFVTAAYLRPMLEEYEGMNGEEALRYRVVADPAPLMARSDESISARVLHEMEVISDETLVRANNFTAGDMPDDTELRRRRAWRLLMANPNFAKALAAEVGLDGIEFPDEGGGGQPAPAVGAPPGFAKAPGVNPELAPELAPTDAESGTQAPENPGFALVDRLTMAADMAVERALERAGARLVTKARRTPTMRDRVAAVDKAKALTLIRPAELDAIGLPPAALLDGAWDAFSMRVRQMVAAYLEAGGRSPLAADDIAALAASQLCTALDTFTIDHLHRPLQPGPTGLRIPDRLIVEALASSGVI